MCFKPYLFTSDLAQMLQVHNPKLCFEEGIPAFVNNFDIHSTFHEGRISGAQPTFIGWVKTIVGLRIHQLGYQMMLLDSDAVFFSNPLPHLDPAAHISASLDCDPTYHPKHNRLALSFSSLSQLVVCQILSTLPCKAFH